MTATFDDDTTGSVTDIAEFESSMPGVATVDDGGTVTAVSPGQTTITVRVVQNAVTQSATVPVQVNPAPPSTANLIMADDGPGNAVYTFSVDAMGANVDPINTLPSPTGAAHFAHDPTNDRLYLTTSDSLLLLSPGSGPTSTVITLAVPGGSTLAGVAYDAPDDILYVSLGGGDIGVYDSASSLSDLSTPTRNIRLSGSPNILALALDPTNNVLYTANIGEFTSEAQSRLERNAMSSSTLRLGKGSSISQVKPDIYRNAYLQE